MFKVGDRVAFCVIDADMKPHTGIGTVENPVHPKDPSIEYVSVYVPKTLMKHCLFLESELTLITQ